MNTNKLFIICIAVLNFTSLPAQNIYYSNANAHSHNDYVNKMPFTIAYNESFGSMEADVFLWKDSLLVGHDFKDLSLKRTLEDLYLKPLSKQISENKGYPYKDSLLTFQLLIDIKTATVPTLDKLLAILNDFPEIIHNKKIKITVSGNRPNQDHITLYPAYIYFDGDLTIPYAQKQLEKIELFSADFSKYSNWNGKGIITNKDFNKIDSIVKVIHAKGKKIRFYGAPDFTNAWLQFMELNIDYINTDKIIELSELIKRYHKNTLIVKDQQLVYTPKYKIDAINNPVKNIILLIGDGCSIPQWYAGYTANKGNLSVFNILHGGSSKTNSANSYITDSAPGASSIATGEKINNRQIGLKPNGDTLSLITEQLAINGYQIGIISSGDITDATPAAFYAKCEERDQSLAILRQLKTAPVSFIAGAGNDQIKNIKIIQKKITDTLSNALVELVLPNFEIHNKIDEIQTNSKSKDLIIDKQAGLSIASGRGNWLSKAFEKATLKFQNNSFFLMLEAAQIDYGGHDNDINYVVNEVLDFDMVIGKALKYADEHEGTLVIITGDHETGGLTLLNGNIQNGKLYGQFSTNDHTAIPVPVFAYGPRSYLFDGVYENTEIYNKIKLAISKDE